MGFLAWDKRTGEIVYSLPVPQGYTGPFNWDFALQNVEGYPEHIGTREDGPELTTIQARRQYKVIDGELVPR